MENSTAVDDRPNIDLKAQHHGAGNFPNEDLEFHNITPIATKGSFSEQHDEKLRAVLEATDKRKTKGAFDEHSVEKAPPPPYSIAVATADNKKSFWRIRRTLLIGAALFFLLIVLLATLLGVLLTQHHNGSLVGSSSGTPASVSFIPTPSHAPTSTSPVPTNSPKSSPGPFILPSPSPVPSNLPNSGDASAPRLNTAIDLVSILNTPAVADPARQAISMKLFFQDDENYLCEKSSVSHFDNWALGDSGNRIMQVMNGTPIAAIVYPDQSLPIRVFFVNVEGFLADIIQEEYGSAGLGARTNAIDASWCDGQGPVVYVQGKDTKLVAFQLSSDKGSSTWSTVPGYHGSSLEESSSSSVNVASVCTFDGHGIAPVFMNIFEPDKETGWLNMFSGENSTELVDLPPSDALLYRPNTPISAVFGNFDPAAPPSSVNMSLFLFYPLPQSLSSLTPNPSLHMVYAPPYPNRPPFFNWTDRYETSLGIVPYSLGEKTLYDQESAQGQNLSYSAGVEGAMPRAWTALRVGGRSDAGTVLVVYQTEDGMGIQVADVLGGTVGTWDVIVPPSQAA